MKQILVAAWLGLTVGWVGFGWAMGEVASGADLAAKNGEIQLSSTLYTAQVL